MTACSVIDNEINLIEMLSAGSKLIRMLELKDHSVISKCDGFTWQVHCRVDEDVLHVCRNSVNSSDICSVSEFIHPSKH